MLTLRTFLRQEVDSTDKNENVPRFIDNYVKF